MPKPSSQPTSVGNRSGKDAVSMKLPSGSLDLEEERDILLAEDKPEDRSSLKPLTPMRVMLLQEERALVAR